MGDADIVEKGRGWRRLESELGRVEFGEEKESAFYFLLFSF